MRQASIKQLALLAILSGCGVLGEKTSPETRAQVGDAVASTGTVLTGAGTATANPILLIVGGLLVAAGVAIKGTSTPKEENKA